MAAEKQSSVESTKQENAVRQVGTTMLSKFSLQGFDTILTRLQVPKNRQLIETKSIFRAIISVGRDIAEERQHQRFGLVRGLWAGWLPTATACAAWWGSSRYLYETFQQWMPRVPASMLSSLVVTAALNPFFVYKTTAQLNPKWSQEPAVFRRLWRDCFRPARAIQGMPLAVVFSFCDGILFSAVDMAKQDEFCRRHLNWTIAIGAGISSFCSYPLRCVKSRQQANLLSNPSVGAQIQQGFNIIKDTPHSELYKGVTMLMAKSMVSNTINLGSYEFILSRRS